MIDWQLAKLLFDKFGIQQIKGCRSPIFPITLGSACRYPCKHRTDEAIGESDDTEQIIKLEKRLTLDPKWQPV